MKFASVVLVLIVLATSQNIDLVGSIDTIRETEGVLKCISDKDPMLNINDIKTFCGKDFLSNRSDCYSAYSSLKLCLINNNCQSEVSAVAIELPCWNCWADMLTTSKDLKEYQDKIRICSSFERYTTVLLSILVILVIFSA